MIITRYDLRRAGMQELRVQDFLMRVTQKFNIKHYSSFAETVDRTKKLLTTHFDLNTLIENQKDYIEIIPPMHKQTNIKLLKELVEIRTVIQNTRSNT